MKETKKMVSCHNDFQVGDKVFCEQKKLYGFISKLSAYGLEKTKSLTVHWENNSRDIFIGETECVSLLRKCECVDDECCD